MRLYRFILALVMSLVLFIGSCPSSLAAEQATAPAKTYKVYIIDQAKLLTAQEEKKLEQEMQELTSYGNIIFTTIRLKKGSNYEKFAEASYYKLCGNEPGVLFQIDMGNRKLTLSCSTKMEELLHDERDSIVDNIYTLATEKRYYECASKCFRQIKTVLNDGEIAHDMKHINNAILALTLGLIINFFIVGATARKKVSKKKLLGKASVIAALTNVTVNKGNVTKTYSPRKSSGGGSSSSGGSSGGGGGGFSGGSSSHGF